MMRNSRPTGTSTFATSTFAARAGTIAGTLALALTAACGGNTQNAASDSATTGATAMSGSTTATTGTASGTMAGDSMAMSGGMAGTAGSLGDASTTAQLDSVATAARGGLTNLAPATAASLIQSLEGKLRGANDPALTEIATDLEQLRTTLTGGTVTGATVAPILERLGSKTSNVASRGGAAQSTLQTIGAELSKAATQLRGGR